MKFLNLLGGGDWADASSEVYVKVKDFNAKEKYSEYMNLGGYSQERGWFAEWLKKEGFVRELEDADDLEIFDTSF